METPVKKNDELVVEIIDCGAEDEGIAKLNGYTIFVVGALKGEKCKIHITKVLSSHAFAKIVEIIIFKGLCTNSILMLQESIFFPDKSNECTIDMTSDLGNDTQLKSGSI